MRPTGRNSWIYFFAVALAAAPFAFGLMRAVGSSRDLRMLWMAFASFFGASVVMVIGKTRGRGPALLLARWAVALVIAMLLAAWTAFQLGATAAPGIWTVSFVLGLCSATGWALALSASVNRLKSSTQRHDA